MENDKAWAARAMRDLDEPMRNALIAQADNVIDARRTWERLALENERITMPFPWEPDFEGDF